MMERKTRKVMEVSEGINSYKVIRHMDDSVSPYRVYRSYYGHKKCGCGMSKRNKQIAKCESLKDAMLVIYQYII